MGRARREYVDALTGEQRKGPGPGVVETGRYVADVRGFKHRPPHTVEIEPADVDRARPSFPVAGEAYAQAKERATEADIRESNAEHRRRQRPAKLERVKFRGVPDTYRSAGKAAREFWEGNALFLDFVAEYGDPVDAVRDWMDPLQVRRGRGWSNLADTTKGRNIIEQLGTGNARGGLLDALTWVFSQNKSKRWDQVDWFTLEKLGDLLERPCDDAHEQWPELAEGRACNFYWWPPGSGMRPLSEMLEELDADVRERVVEETHAERLGEAVAELESAYKRGRKCLPEPARAVIRRRIRHLRKLVREPWRISQAMICGPDRESGFRLCGFPAVEHEAARLTEACELAYDPAWPKVAALDPKERELLGLPPPPEVDQDPDTYDEPRQLVTLEELEAMPHPATMENPTTLPAKALRMWERVYESAQGRGYDKKRSAMQAWGAVKRHYYKRGKRWRKRAQPVKNPEQMPLVDPRQLELPMAEKKKPAKKKPAKKKPAKKRGKKKPPPRPGEPGWPPEAKRITKNPLAWDDLQGELAREYLRTVGAYSKAQASRLTDGEAIEDARGLRPPFPKRKQWAPIRAWLVKLRKRKANDAASAVKVRGVDYALRQANNVGLVDRYGTGYEAEDRYALSDAGRRAVQLIPTRNPASSRPERAKPKRGRPRGSSLQPTRGNPAGPWGELTDLEGKVLELQVRRPDGTVAVHRWTAGHPRLYWSDKRRALVFVHGGGNPRPIEGEPSGAAAKRYARWRGRKPAQLSELELPADKLNPAGAAVRIVYTSDKYRDGVARHHDFGRGVRVWATTPRSPRLFMVKGGRLTVTGRGLVN